jgi:hydroxymethylglutaryl-CoA lyase
MFAALRYSGIAVKHYEVGVRDGIQDVKKVIPTLQKIEWIEELLSAGISHLELTSFVNPKKVPQMSDAEELCQKIPGWKRQYPNTRFSVLIPNLKGYEKCIPYLGSYERLGIDEICLVSSASPTFNLKNLGCTPEEQFPELKKIILDARERKIFSRFYLSNARYCPFEGRLTQEKVVDIGARIFHELNPDSIAWSDTTGQNHPEEVYDLIIEGKRRAIPIEAQEYHGHDTEKRGVKNSVAAIDAGVGLIHGSIAGLGGCPSVPGNNKGNTPTEELLQLYRMKRNSIDIDIEKINSLAQKIKRDIQPRTSI